MAWARRGFMERVLAAVEGRLPRAASGAGEGNGGGGGRGGELSPAAPAAARTARGRVLVVLLPGPDGGPAAVRHYYRGGLLGRLVADLHLGRSRPFREVALYEAARARGVPTLEPLGAVARRARGPLPLYRFDLVTRLVPKARDLASILADGADILSPRRRRDVLAAAARAVRALHEGGIGHADLNLKNVLVVDDERPRALVIDLDGGFAGFADGGVGPRRRLRDLLRLYRSAAKLAHELGRRILTQTDLARFGRAYFEADRVALEGAAQRVRGYAATLELHRLAWPARVAAGGSS